MTDPDRDPEFEAYLRRRSVLSGRERAVDNLEPPHDLDDIVLRKARQAIQAPKELPLYRAPRWALPVGIAATILLCLSVALNVSLNSHRPGEAEAPGAPIAPPIAPAPASPEGRQAQPQQQAVPVQDYSERRAQAPAPDLPSAAASAASAPSRPLAAAPAAPRAAPADASKDPKTWLARIQALQSAGKTAAANAEWQRFRAAFPNFPVDPAVQSPGPTAPPPSEPPKRPLQ
jgi:hypothetical protein